MGQCLICQTLCISLLSCHRSLESVSQLRGPYCYAHAPMHVQVWKDALTRKQQSPYMRHTLAGGTMRDLRFCPYEARLHSPILSSVSLPELGI